MSLFERRPYRAISTLADLIFLNVLWLIACLPVVTIFPSTAAMFGVVRDWTKGKRTGVFGAFVVHFRANLAQSLLVSVPWTLFGAALVADYLILASLDHTLPKFALTATLVLGTFGYAAASIYLFPVMVNYRVGLLTLVRNSLLFGLGRILTSFLCALILLTTAMAISFVPLLVLVLGSVAAYAIYRLCDRTFRETDDLERT